MKVLIVITILYSTVSIIWIICFHLLNYLEEMVVCGIGHEEVEEKDGKAQVNEVGVV